MRNAKWIRQIVCPLLAAIIWGTAFVFQSDSAAHVEPFTYNALRSAVAVAFLALVLLGRRLVCSLRPQAPRPPRDIKALLIGGVCCGSVLSLAAFFQQLGLGETSPGKAAFITALYVVLVPVLRLLVFRKKESPTIWLSVLISVIGLYLLCIHGDQGIAPSDFYVMLCALAFTIHIMVIDHFGGRVDGIELSLVQFAVMTLWSSLGALLTETPSLEAILLCTESILFVGIMSSGVAFTLQIISQKGSNPTVVSLLMCLESVFATLAAVLMRGEWMSGQETRGSILMLIAVMLAQIPKEAWTRLLSRKRASE